MKVAIALLVMISCTVAANLLLKVGAMEPDSQPAVFGFIHWQTAAGLAVFGCSLLIYIWVLRFIPLNLAQSFAAAQFIGVIIASSVFLSESISVMRWIGIAMIALGIITVGITSAMR